MNNKKLYDITNSSKFQFHEKCANAGKLSGFESMVENVIGFACLGVSAAGLFGKPVLGILLGAAAGLGFSFTRALKSPKPGQGSHIKWKGGGGERGG